jgi:hypothetical protein
MIRWNVYTGCPDHACFRAPGRFHPPNYALPDSPIRDPEWIPADRMAIRR